MNIIELAKQAGWSELSLSMIQGCEDEKRLERFRALVLEEAAVECDKRAHAGDAGALMAARAIRALKGPK